MNCDSCLESVWVWVSEQHLNGMECVSVALQSTGNNNRLQTQPGEGEVHLFTKFELFPTWKNLCLSECVFLSVWTRVWLCPGVLKCIYSICMWECGFFFCFFWCYSCSCKMCGLVLTCDMLEKLNEVFAFSLFTCQSEAYVKHPFSLGYDYLTADILTMELMEKYVFYCMYL